MKLLAFITILVGFLCAPIHAVANPSMINLIINKSAKSGIETALALAIAEQESTFNPKAMRWEKNYQTYSVGLFQILYTTAQAEFSFKGDLKALQNPEVNAKLAMRYLEKCQERFSSIEDMACCYKAGFYVKLQVCQRNKEVIKYIREIKERHLQWKQRLEPPLKQEPKRTYLVLDQTRYKFYRF